MRKITLSIDIEAGCLFDQIVETLGQRTVEYGERGMYEHAATMKMIYALVKHGNDSFLRQPLPPVILPIEEAEKLGIRKSEEKVSETNP